MKTIQSDTPWLQKQIKKIEETNSKFCNEIKKIKEINPEIFNEFNHWTPLKLTFLNFTLDVCAIVANKKFKYKNYIDLFAGSGINKTKGKYQDFFIGSPFIALLNHNNKFNSFIFCEKDPLFYNALKNRIEGLNFKAKLYNEDCCCKLEDILKDISLESERAYNFFFIDPYKLEFSWECMKKILNIRSDILITFMTRTIWRTINTEQATGHGHEALVRIFGDESWKNINSEKGVLELYKSNIIKERKDAVVLSTQINST